MLRITGIALLTATVVAILGCGGGSSSLPPNSPLPPPPPNISISPTSALAGSPDLTLTVVGSNFLGETHNFSKAVWSANGSNTILATSFVSSTKLMAVIPAALLRNPGTAEVFVQTGDPMGDVPLRKSNSVSFSVTTPPAGSISISPTSAVAGSPDLTLTVTGSNFTNAPNKVNYVIWSAPGSKTSLSTTYVSSTQLTAVIPAALMSTPVSAKGWVEIWDRLGDVPEFTSNAVSFSVTSTASTDISSGFVSVGSMSTARSGHTATLLMNGKVLIAGGSDETAELFDPASESFAPTGSMSTSRYGATATLLANGKVLIVGGFGPGASELPRLNAAELYDPLTGTFSATGSMTVARVLHTATLLNDGKVLIIGGTTESVGGGAATTSAELYDPRTGVFTTADSMLSDRAQHTATLLASGEVLIVGGWNGHRADAADDPPWDPLFAELFDASGGFKTSGNMSTTRIGHKAIRLANGNVLVLGGIPDPQNVHQSLNPSYAELYDPAAHTFSFVGSLRMSRTGYSATLLTNGKVLLAGGENLRRTVGTAELLDPASASLAATGGLVTERKGHTATLLLDGRVLVTGGVDSNGNTLARAEVYK